MGKDKDIINIIFGDSIAYGKDDNESFGWVNRLRKKDNNMLKNYYFNLSVPGQSSCEIVKRFENELVSRYNSEDIFNLIFSFGIKDALKLNDNDNYIEIFKRNITTIINIAKKYTDNICFIGLLDVNLEIRKQYKKDNIEKIDNTLNQICMTNSVKYINMRNIVNIEDLTDGLHPNSNGHKKISDYLYDNLYKNNNLIENNK